LKDRPSGVVYTVGIPHPSRTRKYYILINYHGHITIGSFAILSAGNRNCSYDYGFTAESSDFRIDPPSSKAVRKLKLKEPDIIFLTTLSSLTISDMNGAAKDALKSKVVTIDIARAQRSIVSRLIGCKRTINSLPCPNCLAVANYISSSRDSFTVYIESSAPQKIKIRGETSLMTQIAIRQSTSGFHTSILVKLMAD
jgi:hypothetical protein